MSFPRTKASRIAFLASSLVKVIDSGRVKISQEEMLAILDRQGLFEYLESPRFSQFDTGIYKAEDRHYLNLYLRDLVWGGRITGLPREFMTNNDGLCLLVALLLQLIERSFFFAGTTDPDAYTNPDIGR